jgi:hypothetical protein
MSLEQDERAIRRHPHLTPQGKEVAIFLRKRVDATGLIDEPQVDIGRDFGTGPARTSQLFSMLVMAKVIHPAKDPGISYKSRSPFWMDNQYVS